LLRDLDHALTQVAKDDGADHRRAGVLALTSLRRNLFPTAPAYGAAA
jgi:hypothetical protein